MPTYLTIIARLEDLTDARRPGFLPSRDDWEAVRNLVKDMIERFLKLEVENRRFKEVLRSIANNNTGEYTPAQIADYALRGFDLVHEVKE